MSKAMRARDVANARRIVEQQKAAERRRRITLWTSVAVVVLLVVAGLIGWGLFAGQQRNTAGSLTTPPGTVDGGTAWAVGDGPVVVDLYEDFMCPICRAFESESGATLKQLVDQKKITIHYHTVAILDASSNGTQYSTRAAGAAAAAAIDGKFLAYHDVLYANQPQEGSSGLTDAKLVDLGKSVGLTSDAFTKAVTDKTYDAWVSKVTDTFSARGFIGTPTVVVAGKQIESSNGGVPSPQQLTQAVDQAAG